MQKFKLPNIEEEKSVLKTIRIKLQTLNKLEDISKKTNISINRLINESIEFAIKNLDEINLKDKK